MIKKLFYSAATVAAISALSHVDAMQLEKIYALNVALYANKTVMDKIPFVNKKWQEVTCMLKKGALTKPLLKQSKYDILLPSYLPTVAYNDKFSPVAETFCIDQHISNIYDADLITAINNLPDNIQNVQFRSIRLGAFLELLNQFGEEYNIRVDRLHASSYLPEPQKVLFDVLFGENAYNNYVQCPEIFLESLLDYSDDNKLEYISELQRYIRDTVRGLGWSSESARKCRIFYDVYPAERDLWKSKHNRIYRSLDVTLFKPEMQENLDLTGFRSLLTQFSSVPLLLNTSSITIPDYVFVHGDLNLPITANISLGQNRRVFSVKNRMGLYDLYLEPIADLPFTTSEMHFEGLHQQNYKFKIKTNMSKIFHRKLTQDEFDAFKTKTEKEVYPLTLTDISSIFGACDRNLIAEYYSNYIRNVLNIVLYTTTAYKTQQRVSFENWKALGYPTNNDNISLQDIPSSSQVTVEKGHRFLKINDKLKIDITDSKILPVYTFAK